MHPSETPISSSLKKKISSTPRQTNNSNISGAAGLDAGTAGLDAGTVGLNTDTAGLPIVDARLLTIILCTTCVSSCKLSFEFLFPSLMQTTSFLSFAIDVQPNNLYQIYTFLCWLVIFFSL
jgi:hypothetical protein